MKSLFDIYGFDAPKASKKVLQNIFGEVKEDERGERELPSGND